MTTLDPARSVQFNKAGGALTVICVAAAFYAVVSGLVVPETTWVRLPLGEISVEA